MKRKYMLIYDTQHSYGEMTFNSEYRANSKKILKTQKMK